MLKPRQNLLYKVSKEGKSSYLFGTIHQADCDVTHLSSEAKSALDNAEVLVLERTIDEPCPPDITEWNRKHRHLLSKGFTASQKATIIKAFQQSQTFGAVQKEAIEEMISQIPPLMLLRLLQKSAPPHKGLTLDDVLYYYALNNGKSISGLEKLKDIAPAADGMQFNMHEQLQYFNYCFENQATNERQYLIKQQYLNGDIELHLGLALNIPIKPNLPPELLDILTRHKEAIFDNRDHTMATSMKTYLDKGNAFIAIGFGHLTGVIKQLTEEGYTIEAISEGPRIYPFSQNFLKDERTEKLMQELNRQMEEVKLQLDPDYTLMEELCLRYFKWQQLLTDIMLLDKSDPFFRDLYKKLEKNANDAKNLEEEYYQPLHILYHNTQLLLPYVTQFDLLLTNLNSRSLRDPDALTCVKILSDSLKRSMQNYINAGDFSEDATEKFTNSAKRAIRGAEPVLSQHRGVKKILGNLLICITGIGALFIAGMAVHSYIKTGKVSLFFEKTNSIKKLESIEDKLDQIVTLPMEKK